MARNLWSDRPLGITSAAFVTAGAVVLALFAVIAVRDLRSTGDTADTLLVSVEVSGDVALADVMHDAVRGDVLQALVSNGQGGLYQGAVAGLAEHDQNFRGLIDEMIGEDLSPEVVAAAEKVTPAVDAYLMAAQQILTTAGRDPVAAWAAYPAFDQASSALKDELPVLGAAAAAFADGAAAHSESRRGTAITLVLAVAAAGALLLALLGWVVTRSGLRPVTRAQAAVRPAHDTPARSGAVAGAAGPVSTGVRTVAAGSEQVGASLRETARNADEVARVAANAVTVAGVRHAEVAERGESPVDITTVLKVVTSIPEQAKLLALHATIEAARA